MSGDAVFHNFAIDIAWYMATPHTFKKTYHNFYEKQRIRSPLLFWSLTFIDLVFIYLSVVEVLDHKPLGLTSFTTSGFLIFTLLVPIPLSILLFVTRFETVINEDGIFYKWLPLGRKYSMIQWENVREISLIEIPGTAAMLFNSGKFKEINYLGGGVGLLFVMKSGRKRLFSTSKAEELNHKLIRIAGKKYKNSDVGQDKDYSD